MPVGPVAGPAASWSDAPQPKRKMVEKKNALVHRAEINIALSNSIVRGKDSRKSDSDTDRYTLNGKLPTGQLVGSAGYYCRNCKARADAHCLYRGMAALGDSVTAATARFARSLRVDSMSLMSGVRSYREIRKPR